MDLVSQNLLLTSGGKKDSTYVDDVFHTEVFKSTNANADYKVTNNIDNSGEGGLVWYKDRLGTSYHMIFDTERGSDNYIYSNATSGQNTSTQLKSFDSDGYTFKTGTNMVNPARNAVVWNFRKAPGFFDIVTYTGNATTRTISHSLGSVPGLIIIKDLTSASDWFVYHQSMGNQSFGKLNTTNSFWTGNDVWNSTSPTSTNFTINGNNTAVNTNSNSYVAYVFAGGESTAATARSVAFSSTGVNDGAKSLTIAGSSGTNFGSGDFTMECWFKDTRTSDTTGLDTIFAMSDYTTSSSNNSFSIYTKEGGFLIFNRTSGGFSTQINTTGGGGFTQTGSWHHFAWTRSGSGSNNNTIWVDGSVHGTFTNTLSYTDGQNFYIGGNNYDNTGTPNKYGFNGNISNVRLIKGQAIYTASFKPSYEPLTTTTGGATSSNVKVICCNNSSITGSSLTSGTISSTNTPTASTDSPFDDPEGFKFGENEDQNIIKCGSYVGDGTKNHDIYLGWEPSWVMIKCTTASENWLLFDVMRGIVTGGNDGLDAKLYANTSSAEVTNTYNLEVTPTGFKLTQDQAHINNNEADYIFLAIRRPDGYVGKPPEAGTDVFTPILNATDNAAPFYRAANHVVDFALAKRYDYNESWWSSSRLIQGKYLQTNTTSAEQSNSYQQFDFSSGYNSYTGSAAGNNIGYLWKRHAGFDVVTYKGSGFNAGEQQDVPHSLNKIPEMMWVKIRGAANQNWMVYHKGLNGGTNPEQYKVDLNSSGAESSFNCWDNTAPTANHFRVGNQVETNHGSYNFIAMLFASVDGISKVGSFTPDASGSFTVTTGFTPRFIVLKPRNINDNNWGSWWVYDSTRGLTSGLTNRLQLSLSAAQISGSTNGVTATGINFTGFGDQSASNWIYYAHA